jgi:hypothetical protein
MMGDLRTELIDYVADDGPFVTRCTNAAHRLEVPTALGRAESQKRNAVDQWRHTHTNIKQYKAIVHRNGVYQNPAGHSFNWNQDLVGPMQEELKIQGWKGLCCVFSTRVHEETRRLKSMSIEGLNRICDEVRNLTGNNQAIEEALIEWRDDILEGFDNVSARLDCGTANRPGTIRRDVSQNLNAGFNDLATNVRTQLTRILGPPVNRSVYDDVANIGETQGGQGVLVRMSVCMRDHITGSFTMLQANGNFRDIIEDGMVGPLRAQLNQVRVDFPTTDLRINQLVSTIHQIINHQAAPAAGQVQALNSLCLRLTALR